MTHYDTLGVKPDASLDDIKAAYRRKASKAHPDKEGGSGKEMADINKANDVLSDPERRARYDAGESDNNIESVEEVARKEFRSLIALFLEREGNIVNMMRDHIAGARNNVNTTLISLRSKVDRLEKRRDKIVSNISENIFTQVIDIQVAQIKKQIQELEYNCIIIIDEIEKLLLQYECTEEQTVFVSGHIVFNKVF